MEDDKKIDVAGSIGANMQPITCDPVPHPSNAGQQLDVDVDQVARLVPLVVLQVGFGLQIPQAPEPSLMKALASVEKGACRGQEM